MQRVPAAIASPHRVPAFRGLVAGCFGKYIGVLFRRFLRSGASRLHAVPARSDSPGLQAYSDVFLAKENPEVDWAPWAPDH